MGFETGLTKREYFAGLAMQSLIRTFDYPNMEEVATKSARCADELMIALAISEKHVNETDSNG